MFARNKVLVATIVTVVAAAIILAGAAVFVPWAVGLLQHSHFIPQTVEIGTDLILVVAVVVLMALGAVLVLRLLVRLVRQAQGNEIAYRTICESVLDGIVVIDQKGVIQSVNAAVPRLFGFSKSELCGQNVSMIMPEPFALEHDAYLRRYRATGEKRIIGIGRQVHGRRKDGSLFPMDLSVTEITAAGRRKFIGLVRDVTARIEANTELRQLKTTLDLTQDSVYMFDPESLKFFYTNRAAKEEVGYSADELLGMTPVDIKPEFSEQSFRQMLESLIAGPDHSITFQTAHQHKDGTLRPVEVILQYVAPTGEPPRFVAHVRNIAERKRMSEALIAAKEKAEQSAISKAKFLATMSHEIRTPMNGVLGMLELLQDSDLDPTQKEYVSGAVESAGSLLTIVNDVLDFSKIEAGQLMIETIPIDLHSKIEQAAAAAARLAIAKSLELNCYIAPQVPENVTGDPVRLRQVLLNLLDNAIKFTDRGEVNLRVERVAESSDQVGLRFSVKDTGPGIPAARQAELFDAFTQADSSTTRRFGGTGLGLSISRQLVELMGGEIGVDSMPGQGSTFWFTSRFGKVAQPVTRAFTGIPRGSKVLIVDDNATNREILAGYLASCKVSQLNSVGDGRSALKILREAAVGGAPYRFVIMDYHMPQMDGLELARDIRADASLSSPQLILMSSVGDADEAIRQAGFDHQLLKPVRQSDVCNILRDQLDEGEKKPGAPDSAAHPGAGPGLQGFRVLLADDVLTNQMVCREMLLKMGIEVEVVGDGQQAVAAVAEKQFDLVLMDCSMPLMDGYTATGLIRAKEQALRLPRLPIIAMTAHALEGDREVCIAAGMDDYLVKPLRFTLMQEMMARWLSVEKTPG